MERNAMHWVKKVAFYTLVALVIWYAVFPFYYAILSSLKNQTDIINVHYFPFSFDITFDNYGQVFENDPFAGLGALLAVALDIGLAVLALFFLGKQRYRRWGAGLLVALLASLYLFQIDWLSSLLDGQPFLTSIFNSVVVALGVVALATLLGLTAAFALARVRFRGRSMLLLTILGVSIFPQVAVLSGLFELIRFMGLFDTLWALTFSYMIFTLPFTVWVLTTFMRDLPVELEEAAIMDGATPWQIIWKVFMPIMWPALVTTGLLAFIAAWNEFLFALTFTQTDARTVPVKIAQFSGASSHADPWGNLMAASVVVTVPVVALVLIFQRRIVAGLTDGGVKG